MTENQKTKETSSNTSGRTKQAPAAGSTKKPKRPAAAAKPAKTDRVRRTASGSTFSKSERTARGSSSGRADKATAARLRREQEVHHTKVMIACGLSALAVILFLFFALPRLTGSMTVKKGNLVGVNSDVLQYEGTVAAYCKEYKISQFSTLMLAMMQQESSGQGTDVLQCSESPFNTEYANEPGSIADPDYSIRVGVETFAYCLEQAGCKRISDTDGVKLALQEYNFGNDYAGWALANYGGYSPENAYEYSEMMKVQLGWDTYGDPEYVSHVLNYYDW